MGEPGVLERAGRGAEVVREQREQDVLRGGELVLEALRLALGALEEVLGLAREPDVERPRLARQTIDLAIERGAHGSRIGARLLEEGGHEPLRLADERVEDVLGVQLGLALLGGQGLRGDERFACLDGDLIESHGGSLRGTRAT